MFWRLGWRHIKLRKLQYSLIALAIMTPVATAGAFAVAIASTLDASEANESEPISTLTLGSLVVELLPAAPWILALVFLSIMAAVCGGAGFRVVSAERLREAEELSRIGASPTQLRRTLAAPGAIVTTIAAFLPFCAFSVFLVSTQYPLAIFGVLIVTVCTWIAGLVEVWRATKNHDQPGAKPDMLGTAAASHGKRRAIIGLVMACIGAFYLIGRSIVWLIVEKTWLASGLDINAVDWMAPYGEHVMESLLFVVVALTLFGFGLFAAIPWVLRQCETLPSRLPVTLRLGLRDVSRSSSVFTPLTQVAFVSCLAVSSIAVATATQAKHDAQSAGGIHEGDQLVIELILLGLSLAVFITIASVSTGFVRLTQSSRQESYHALGSQPVQRRQIALVHAVTPCLLGTIVGFLACAFGAPAILHSLMYGTGAPVAVQIPWLTVLVPPILTIGVVAAIAWFSTPADVSPKRRIT